MLANMGIGNGRKFLTPYRAYHWEDFGWEDFGTEALNKVLTYQMPLFSYKFIVYIVVYRTIETAISIKMENKNPIKMLSS